MTTDLVPSNGHDSPLLFGADNRPLDPELRALEFASSLVDRYHWARQIGLAFSRHGRDLYHIFDYPHAVSPQMHRQRYDRGGVAGRIIDAKPHATWRGEGGVVEDEDVDVTTTFEKAFNELNKRLSVWPKLQRVDILSSLGGFAVLLIGVNTNGDLAAPLPKGNNPKQLIYLRPLGGGSGATNVAQIGHTSIPRATIIIKSSVEDTKDPRYGLPEFYEIQQPGTASNSERRVHWSRVVHVPAEGFLDDEIYGPPRLDRIWNLLCDLDKVSGGGAEAFFLRANQGMQVDIDPKMAIKDIEAEKKALHDQMKEYRDGFTRWLRTRGVDVKMLGSDVANFSSPMEAIVTLIAGCVGIPKRILLGSEMGELASSQDRSNWHDVINDRRTSYAGPMIARAFVDRMIEYGYLPEPDEYDVEWTDLANMTDEQRVEIAGKAAAMNDHGQLVIEANEIRDRFLDMEPLPEPETPDQSTQAQVDQLTQAMNGNNGGVMNVVVGGKKQQALPPGQKSPVKKQLPAARGAEGIPPELEPLVARLTAAIEADDLTTIGAIVRAVKG